MRKRFGQRMKKGEGVARGPDLRPSASTGVRGGNLVLEVAQWLVTTITLGQAVWRWVSRPKSRGEQPPAVPPQGRAA
jgi:hypothetical protein